MTDFVDRHQENLYDDETKVADIAVTIEASSLRRDRNEDVHRALQRVRRAAKAEAQAIQDELDEEGEVHEA